MHIHSAKPPFCGVSRRRRGKALPRVPMYICTTNMQDMQATESHDKLVQLRMSQRLFDLIDDYRRSQPDLPSRSEAIRRLVEQALKADDA